MVSTGLFRAASGGRNSARAARISLGRGGTVRPPASHASAARMPGPPPLVRMATRPPAGNGWFASRDATSKNSPSVSVRTTPAWWKRASTVTSDAPISAPVCDDVARAPAADRPLFTAGEPGELARVANRFEIEGDDGARGIVFPVLQEIVAREVRLVADRDEAGEAEPQSVGVLDDGQAEGAALGEETDPAA